MSETSANSRLEAFCDGVFAIALTLLIIDVKAPTATVHTTNDVWASLASVGPLIFSFLLSFVVILISWVNHHNALKLVDKSSPQFVYANGFLLLTIVFIPFPTALLGKYLFTDHAAPAVILYSAICGLQGFGWYLMTRTSLAPQMLARSEKARLAIIDNRKYAIFAMSIYTACAIAAIWIPQAVAVVLTLIWMFWVIVGMRIREE